MEKCSVAMLLGKSAWLKTLDFFMASDPEGMNCFTELVFVGNTGRGTPYLWILEGLQ